MDPDRPDDATGPPSEYDKRAARQREFSRRELLQAGMAVPVALGVGGLLAACGGGTSHSDHTGSPGHSDATHTDTTHGDSGHSNTGHHTDTPHVDTHCDTSRDHPKVLEEHTDASHSDVHTSNAHDDHAHADEAPLNRPQHVDGGTLSTHGDLPHADTPHADQPAFSDHGDCRHADTPHGDSH